MSYPQKTTRNTSFPRLELTKTFKKRKCQYPNSVLPRFWSRHTRYRSRLTENLVPCSDLAGEVVAVGCSVSEWSVGDRVMSNFCTDHIYGHHTTEIAKSALGGGQDGVLTQYRVLPAHALIRIPSHFSYVQASTLPCAAVTAYTALHGPVPVKAGDYVLVQGTGGVSMFALQFAVASGAIVIATSSSNEKLKEAEKLGATHLINYKETPDWDKEVQRITGGVGVDHIVEVGGPATLYKSINAVQIGGQINVIGFLLGGPDQAELAGLIFPIILKTIQVRGIWIGPVEKFKAMIRLIEANPEKTIPVVDKVFPFDQAIEAYAYLESQQHFLYGPRCSRSNTVPVSDESTNLPGTSSNSPHFTECIDVILRVPVSAGKVYPMSGTDIGTYKDLQKREVPVPQLGPTEVLVKIHAVSLQYRDLAIAKGQYGAGLTENFVPCSDLAGEVVAVGYSVSEWKVGDRVASNFCTDHIYGEHTTEIGKSALGGAQDGVLTQYRVLPAHGLVRIPSHFSYVQASTLPCAAVTAYNALHGPVPIKAGDYVLVQGTGGVSIFALQFAVASGATVIATSSSNEKLKEAEKLGAKYLINYKETPDWDKEVQRITGGVGVDHIIEVGGPSTLLQSINAARIGGRVNLIGFLLAAPDKADLAEYIFPIIRKAIQIRGIFIGPVEKYASSIGVSPPSVDLEF
ncbi:hypothetical protein NMY22_g19228 [Coprinellus aureogranulatus]|nr:hypothetical protein NMY22_g19228 [Coprinellus aureogranulatus]